MTFEPLPSVVSGYVCPWSSSVLGSGMLTKGDEREFQTRGKQVHKNYLQVHLNDIRTASSQIEAECCLTSQQDHFGGVKFVECTS